MTHFEPGAAVTWLSVPRGGYGFVHPVDGVVLRSTSVRIISALGQNDRDLLAGLARLVDDVAALRAAWE